MRGLVESRAIAILTRSRGPSSYIQGFSFSAGRGRGNDAPAFGFGGGAGRGSGLGDLGVGRGRGRGSPSPIPSPTVSSQPLPFKPFTLGPTEVRPNAAAERPAVSQQVSQPLSDTEHKAISNSQFEDAITEKTDKIVDGASDTPLGAELAASDGPSNVLHGAGRGIVVDKGVPWNSDLILQTKKGHMTIDIWETRPRPGPGLPGDQHAKQGGAGRGTPVKPYPGIASRNVAPNAEKKRASVWDSLSQILAAPGKPAVRPTPSLPSPAPQESKQPDVQPEAQAFSPSRVIVDPLVEKLPDVGPTQGLAHSAEVSATSKASQSKNAVTADPAAQLSDASYVAMIKYHQAAGRMVDVDQIYEEMEADGVYISIPTYNLLIQVYSQAGQFDKMDKVYKQMRQALTQSKEASLQPKKEKLEQEQILVHPTVSSTVVSNRSLKELAPEVPVTLEEQSSPDLQLQASDSVKSASVTHNDELSAKLGEWGVPTAQPAEVASKQMQPTPTEEELATKSVPQFEPPSPATEQPDDSTPRKLSAHRIEESETLHSFQGLLKKPPPGKFSEDSSRVGSFSPFNLPSTPSPSIIGGIVGRGRGAPLLEVGGRAGRGRGAPVPQHGPIGVEPEKVAETMIHTELSREQARERAMALLAKGKEPKMQVQRKVASQPSPSPPRPQLSREDARQRAVAVMNEGIERNLSREDERRRRGGSVESFSDATDFVASRFRRRTPDSITEQAKGPPTQKDRFKRQPRFMQRRVEDDEPQVPLTLREMTKEDEKRLMKLEEEEQFKSSLHTKFLVDFEPQYAMEFFGINPDIDEKPRMSLADTLDQAKPFLMVEGMTDEQWQGEVQDVLEKAPHLEKLVKLYAGPDRMTSREQNLRLQSVAEAMPAHVAPEIQDFMQRALLTLQSNPGIRMKEKERLMGKFVSGLSSF